jgi:hypothetical protein
MLASLSAFASSSFSCRDSTDITSVSLSGTTNTSALPETLIVGGLSCDAAEVEMVRSKVAANKQRIEISFGWPWRFQGWTRFDDREFRVDEEKRGE